MSEPLLLEPGKRYRFKRLNENTRCVGMCDGKSCLLVTERFSYIDASCGFVIGTVTEIVIVYTRYYIKIKDIEYG